jgi:acetyl coenzyme A synthetase (ADP forming)-like protein
VTPLVSSESDVALRDGSTVHVRPVQAGDATRIERFLDALSADARWFRFFSGATDVSGTARWLADMQAGTGLVAVTADDGRVVGHAHYVPYRAGSAEVAFAIADAWQGRGIATLLLAQLAEAATGEGIDRFTAVVMSENHKMIATFRDSGFPVEIHTGHGELQVALPTVMSEDGRRRFTQREQGAAIAAVGHVLRPRSIAVIGASRRSGSVGAALMGNLLAGAYTGAIFPVNLDATEIMGLPAYASVRDAPDAPELAIIAVPAEHVLEVARDCADIGVRALVVLSAGFSEAGDAGREREQALVAICRAAGMRLVGPNCLGVVNTDPGVVLNATFAPGVPPRGRVGFASQSGAFGIAALDIGRSHGIGLSSFASVGDKADLSGNDFLQYWEADEHTDVIALYLESFGNPAKFGRIARRVSARKPILAVKSGRSVAGRRAASSHTGALLAAADTSVDALFRHAGVIRTDTVAEMFDAASLLSRQPLPQGSRVAIVTNAGGPAILCADACAGEDLCVEPLAASTRAALSTALRPEASVTNPVDLIASATAGDYERALDAVLADPAVDSVIAIFVRPLATLPEDVVRVIRSIGASPRADATPLLGVFLGPDAPENIDTGVPIFRSVEEAVRALGHATRYARYRAAPLDPPAAIAPEEDDAVAAEIAAALGDGGGWMAPPEVDALLRAARLPVVESRWVSELGDIVGAVDTLGDQVAIKATGPGLLHKSDLGAVRLAVSAEDAHGAASDVYAAVVAAGTTPDGFLLQRMVPSGVELIIGAIRDPQFGPLVAVGAGGRTAELIADVQVRLAPIGPREASTMLHDLRTFPLLDGFRGSPSADVPAVEAILERVAALAAAHPEIAELDCNPVVAGPEGAVIVDARIRIEPVPARPPVGALNR